MSNNDLHNNIKQVQAIIPAAIGANATKTGAIIDRQNYGGVEFVIDYGSVTTTGSVVTIVCKEGDVTGTLTSVADTDLLGTEALASLLAGARVAGTGKEVSKRLGYKGTKRYTKLTITPVNNASAALLSAVCILSRPAIAPTANPPA